jgi:hypothetical protein
VGAFKNMPKRSNPFQNLFHLIYRQMGGTATVTESKMLRDKETGAEREVDIVIESDIVGERITIGVECNAEARPASVEWVEQMRGKHQALPTDKVILVSRSGFYKNAIKKAELYGYSTISLGEAIAADWTRIVGKKPAMYFESFDNNARYRLLLKAGDGSLENWAPPNEKTIRMRDGTFARINDVVNSIVASPDVRQGVLDHLDASGDPYTIITYKPHPDWHALQDDGEWREIAQIDIILETTKLGFCKVSLAPVGP